MIQDARGWCTGMTQRDGTGREVGGGFRMGNTCTPMADSCCYMAKPIQYCKVINLQLKKKIKFCFIFKFFSGHAKWPVDPNSLPGDQTCTWYTGSAES